MPKVCVIDYGIGNVSSVIASFDRIGIQCSPLDNPKDLKGASHVVLPGVGAFGSAMNRLEEFGWVSAIREHANNGNAVLGICLGMQLLAEASCEGIFPALHLTKYCQGNSTVSGSSSDTDGPVTGLGLISGTVKSLKDIGYGGRLPHIGWNTVRVTRDGTLFAGLPDELEMYFVHSYGLEVCPLTIATTSCAGEFSAAIQSGNIFGTQFHPEKSSKYGLGLLRNFVNWS